MMDEPRLGIVVYDRGNRPDAMFASVVRRLKERGVRVGGLLQEVKGDAEDCCASLKLEDIATGQQVEIFQDRGAHARGCRLDPAGLAKAAELLREAVEAHPEILFVNRFGREEAEGRGLLDEIAAAVLADIPVIVAVGEALLPAWQAYAGPGGIVLRDEKGLEEWCLRQVGIEDTSSGARRGLETLWA